MKNTSLKSIFLGAVSLIAIVALLFLGTKSSSDAHLEMIAKDEFTPSHLLPLQKDSFISLLNKKYGDQLQIVSRSPLELHIKNSGSKVSDFYNDNERILDVKSFGFDIEKGEQNKLIAKFEVEKIDNKEYILLPTDVVYGVFRN